MTPGNRETTRFLTGADSEPTVTSARQMAGGTTAPGIAPTLLGAQAAGNRAFVQVWAPSGKRLDAQKRGFQALVRSAVLMVILMPVCWVLSFLFADQVMAAGVMFIALGCYAAFVSIWALVSTETLPEGQTADRPRLVTTDSQGIAITTHNGSRAFPWSEIVGIRWRRFSGQLRIRLNSREWTSVILSAHTEGDQDALLQMIVSNCDLLTTRRSRRALEEGGS
jgi:hypothetical protein